MKNECNCKKCIKNRDIKRNLIATAALKRKENWKQKTSAIGSKEKLLAKIIETQRKSNIRLPIGLESANVKQLQKYYQYIKEKK